MAKCFRCGKVIEDGKSVCESCLENLRATYNENGNSSEWEAHIEGMGPRKFFCKRCNCMVTNLPTRFCPDCGAIMSNVKSLLEGIG